MVSPLLITYCCDCHRRRILIFVVSVALLFSHIACAKRSRSSASANNLQTTQTQIENGNASQTARININTASAKELEALPGIGEGLAQRIIEHREKYGPFRRAEHLMMVRGISDKRFRALREMITVE